MDRQPVAEVFVMGLPAGYGKANNPTGKGLVHDGSQGMGGLAQKAGHALTKMMIDIIMEPGANGKSRAENAVRKQAQMAEMGNLESLKWFTDRIMGKVVQAIEGKDGGPIVITLTQEDADL